MVMNIWHWIGWVAEVGLSINVGLDEMQFLSNTFTAKAESCSSGRSTAMKSLFIVLTAGLIVGRCYSVTAVLGWCHTKDPGWWLKSRLIVRFCLPVYDIYHDIFDWLIFRKWFCVLLKKAQWLSDWHRRVVASDPSLALRVQCIGNV